MKPILFNTDMVRAILDGRKTVTRRVVKPPYYIDEKAILPKSGLCMHKGTNETGGMPYADALYHPGDILYVRETWNTNPLHDLGDEPNEYVYKADYDGHAGEFGWHPSIHMPKEAARLFLRVTDVRVERLQDISADSCAIWNR